MNAETLILENPSTPCKVHYRELNLQNGRLQSAISRVIDPMMISSNGSKILVALDAPRRASEGVPWLHFLIDGHPAAIQVPYGVARRLIALPAEGAIPEDAALLLEAALAPWLDEIEALLGASFRFIALQETADDLPIETTFDIRGKDATGSFVQMRQAVRLSPDGARQLIDVLSPRRARRENLQGLDLKIAWEIGRVDLDLATLESLVPGDAIELPADEQGRVVIEGQMSAPAVLGPDGARLTGPFVLSQELEEYYMTEATTETAEASEVPVEETNQPTAAPAKTEEVAATEVPKTPSSPASASAPDSADELAIPPADLNEVEMRLSFRMGTATMPLKSLRELAPGSIIETLDEANSAVDILANGRVVGSGEVINLAGRRAVQIRRIFTGQ